MLVEALNLGVCFSSQWVFRERSFSLAHGDRVALVGESGSGKSLFLKCISMLQRADEGEVRFQGKPVGGAEVPVFRRSVMYLPQASVRFGGSVEDFLRQPYTLSGWSEASFDVDRCERLLDQFGRDRSFLDKPHRDLSGGEGQLAALIRGVLLDPVALLLDEPTSAMDTKTAAVAESVVEDWVQRSDQKALVWVSHDRQQSERVADRFVEF